MEKTWKPTTAGILNIIAGAINVFCVIGLSIVLVATSTWTFMLNMIPPQDFPFVAPLITTILTVLLIFSVIEAVFPILGGVFALQRKKWGWALAGSIISILGFLPLGVLATIFVSMAKGEFESSSAKASPSG